MKNLLRSQLLHSPRLHGELLVRNSSHNRRNPQQRIFATRTNTRSEFERAKTMPHTSKLPKPSPWSTDAVLKDLPNAPISGTATPIQFFHYVERLKLEKREGWRRFGISSGESIADHMYRMSIITMLAPPTLSSRLDIARCTKMALIHDMAEGLVGDLTPVDGVPKHEKNRREAATIDWIANGLLGKVHAGVSGRDLQAAWQEYEDSVTPESKFVHDVDKIELLLQMVEYERTNGCEIDLSEFSWVATRLTMPEMKQWAQEILDERSSLWKSHGKEPRDPAAAHTIQAQQDEYYDGRSDVKETTNGSVDVKVQTNGHPEQPR